ncbi:putative glycosyl transferase [Anabaenopsis circularis NIES-21]|uniref:Putative glycosyl transferase n=1 Tax=Anabaenopsis circularis NIES-21 TaxID=1085406 RepID=A0A1Z4GM30_9CYAN|nr:putative glycosyl transferase [Anabaenopsis circularis NIES-21]
MPLVSVIIPVYNAEKTIQKTIKSVLEQSLPDFELIIINSSSSDSTLNQISSFQDCRIKLFTYPQANASVNRNRGLLHTTTEFVSFLDADDLWKPDKLKSQYQALQENNDATVAYSFTDAIDENDNFLRKCSHATWTGNVYAQLLLDDFIGSGSNVMVRRQAFREVGEFDELLTNAEDTDMWLKLAANYNFIPIKKVQILYRISTNSKSSNILGSEASNLRIINKVFNNVPHTFKQLKPYRVANLYKYLSYKALTVEPGQQKTFHTARFLWMIIINDSTILKKMIIYKAIIKLIIMSILPKQLAKLLLDKFPKISDVSTFFGYIKTEI